MEMSDEFESPPRRARGQRRESPHVGKIDSDESVVPESSDSGDANAPRKRKRKQAVSSGDESVSASSESSASSASSESSESSGDDSMSESSESTEPALKPSARKRKKRKNQEGAASSDESAKYGARKKKVQRVRDGTKKAATVASDKTSTTSKRNGKQKATVGKTKAIGETKVTASKEKITLAEGKPTAVKDKPTAVKDKPTVAKYKPTVAKEKTTVAKQVAQSGVRETNADAGEIDGSDSSDSEGEEDGVLAEGAAEFYARRERLAEEAGIVKHLPRFARKYFRTTAATIDAQRRYERANYVAFRRRDVNSIESWNEKHPHNPIITKKGIVHRRFVLYCTHGCKTYSRSTGIRTHHRTRYTGCKARATFVLQKVKRKKGWRWRYVITSEHTTHNHNVNKFMYTSYQNSAMLTEEDMLGPELDLLIETETDVAQIARWMSARKGVPITPQQVRNILARRLGGPNAEARAKQIVTEFLEIDGNRAGFLKDDNDITVGIALQSLMQALCFEVFHDVVGMDLTYNTNNVGYKMGSLIITGPTGRGLPVLDFLCLSESKPTLTQILQWFRDNNPAAEHVEAFVVDKSMAEMGAIESVFPEATIFLCQFHVKQAVGRALAQRRFGLSAHSQAAVATLFSKLMYSRTEHTYRDNLVAFRAEVGALDSALLAYFEANWFTMRDKWSNVGRAARFSAGNSTTNRVESNWTRIKAIIGDKKGIDRCVSAMLQNQLNVYRQLQSALVVHGGSSRTFIGIPYFLRPVAAVLSDFAYEKVSTQWAILLACNTPWRTQWAVRPSTSTTSAPSTSTTSAPSTSTTPAPSTSTTPAPSTSTTPAPSTSTTPAPSTSTTPAPSTSITPAPLTRLDSVRFSNDPSALRKSNMFRIDTPTSTHIVCRSGVQWTCDCFFATSHRLPCQHMMHVAKEVRCSLTLSRASVTSRWSLDEAVKMLDELTGAIADMTSLRLLTRRVLPVGSEYPVPKRDAARANKNNFQIIRVPKYVHAKDPLVLRPEQKRNIVKTTLEGITDLIVNSGSAVFYERVARLEELLAALSEAFSSANPIRAADVDRAEVDHNGSHAPPSQDTETASNAERDATSEEDMDDEDDSCNAGFPPDTTDFPVCGSQDCPPDSDYEDEEDDAEEDDEAEATRHASSTGKITDACEDQNNLHWESGRGSDVDVDMDNNNSFNPSVHERSGAHDDMDHCDDDTDEYAADLGGFDGQVKSFLGVSPSAVSFHSLDLSASSLGLLEHVESQPREPLEAQPLNAASTVVPSSEPTPSGSAARISGAAMAPASGAGAATSEAKATSEPTPSGAAMAPASGAGAATSEAKATSEPTPSGAAMAPASHARVTSGAAVVGGTTASSSDGPVATSGTPVAPKSGPAQGRFQACGTCSSKAFEVCKVAGEVAAEIVCANCGTIGVATESSSKRIDTSSAQEVIEVSSGETSHKKYLKAIGRIRERNKRLSLRPVPIEKEYQKDAPNHHDPLPVRRTLAMDDVADDSSSVTTAVHGAPGVPTATQVAEAKFPPPFVGNIRKDSRQKQLRMKLIPSPSQTLPMAGGARGGWSGGDEVDPDAAELARRVQEQVRKTVVEIKFPPKPKGNTRKDARKKPEASPKPAPLPPVAMDEFNFWANNTTNVNEFVQKYKAYSVRAAARGQPTIKVVDLGPPYGMHNFTLDTKFASKLNAALTESPIGATLIEVDSDDEDNAPSRQTRVVQMPGEDIVYSEAYVHEVLEYHELDGTQKKWTLDRDWITTLKPKSAVFANLFPIQSVGGRYTPAKVLREHVARRFDQLALASTFQTPRTPRSMEGSTIFLAFKDLLGHIARTEWISDAVMLFCLNKLMEKRTDVIILNSLAPASAFKPPFDDITTIKYVIQPISIGKHWVLLVVELFWTLPTPEAVAHVYEPTMSDTAIDTVKSTFEETHNVLERWMQRLRPDGTLKKKTTVWAGPTQPRLDGHSCGFLCLVVAYAIVTDFQFSHEIQTGGSFKESDMEVLRLKLLHLILVDSTVAPRRHTDRQARILDKVEYVMRNTAKNAV